MMIDVYFVFVCIAEGGAVEKIFTEGNNPYQSLTANKRINNLLTHTFSY